MIWTTTSQQKLIYILYPPKAFNIIQHNIFPGLSCLICITDTHKFIWFWSAELFAHMLKSDITCLPKSETQVMSKPGQEREFPSSQACPSPSQASTLGTHYTADDSSRCPGAGKLTKLLVRARGSCLMRTATFWLPQELLGFLSSEEPMSVKHLDFHFSHLELTLPDKSETSFLLLCCTSELETPPLLAKHRGFYPSSSSHIWLLLQIEAFKEKHPWWYFHSQLLISNSPILHAAAVPSFATGQLTRSWRLKQAPLLHPGPGVKQMVENVLWTCCKA